MDELIIAGELQESSKKSVLRVVSRKVEREVERERELGSFTSPHFRSSAFRVPDATKSLLTPPVTGNSPRYR